MLALYDMLGNMEREGHLVHEYGQELGYRWMIFRGVRSCYSAMSPRIQYIVDVRPGCLQRLRSQPKADVQMSIDVLDFQPSNKAAIVWTARLESGWWM